MSDLVYRIKNRNRRLLFNRYSKLFKLRGPTKRFLIVASVITFALWVVSSACPNQ